jgi:hypothetical protein
VKLVEEMEEPHRLIMRVSSLVFVDRSNGGVKCQYCKSKEFTGSCPTSSYFTTYTQYSFQLFSRQFISCQTNARLSFALIDYWLVVLRDERALS